MMKRAQSASSIADSIAGLTLRSIADPRVAVRCAAVCLTWGVLAFGATSGFAADEAVLRNGFSIEHERRELRGDITRLFPTLAADDFVDVATADIDHFEAVPAGAREANSGKSGATAPQNTTQTGSMRENTRENARENVPENVPEAIQEFAKTSQLDPLLIESIVRAESGFRPRAVSRKGARGLMQLMPGTASGLGVKDAFDVQQNLSAGTRYFCGLLEHYHFDLVKALAAYNAGAAAVDRHRGVPPYAETRAYVARIIRDFNARHRAQMRAAKAFASVAASRSGSGPASVPALPPSGTSPSGGSD